MQKGNDLSIIESQNSRTDVLILQMRKIEA